MFNNGSNPYLKYNMTPIEFAEEIMKWSQNYELTFQYVSGSTIFNFLAVDKYPIQTPFIDLDDLP
jgi:hypothetical protein